MRNLGCSIACLCVLALSPVRADEPQPAAASTSDKQPAKPDAQSEADAKAKAEALDARFRALGYKPKIRKGITLYCHNEQQIGSRLERTVCATAEELDFAIQIGRYVGPAGQIGLSGIKFN
jgi:hypothetical protein